MEPPPATAPLSRKPSCCYIADDDDEDVRPDGHAEGFDRSLDNMEAGYRRPPLDFLFRRDSAGSPRRTGCFGRWMAAECEDREPHFLDTCRHCKQPLRNNKDIFMYRGDTPFCSEECRQERIELDQKRERKMRLSSSSSSSVRGATSPSGSPDRRLHTDTVAVA